MPTVDSPPHIQDLDALTARCNHFLARILPPAEQPPTRLHEAIRYAVLGPGKRLRPLLVYTTGLTFSAPIQHLDYLAAAVECIHAYSLIHDDLPAMDNDDLRRGRATCHKAFDEATAILAGDALQSFAFSLLTQYSHHAEDKVTQAQLIQILGEATGSEGMAGGQMFDIQSSMFVKTEADLQTIHRMKTGALIRASIVMPAILANTCSLASIGLLSEFAEAVGLGFQIRDDILDVEACQQQTGKTSGSDARLDKLTYPSLLGLDGAKQRADELLQHCLMLLEQLPQSSKALQALATMMINRDR